MYQVGKYFVSVAGCFAVVYDSKKNILGYFDDMDRDLEPCFAAHAAIKRLGL